ncbi:zonular occludens toxin domain-containing protein [Vibrio breoganii]
MIYAITGRPGGGKSYEAVAFHILPALKDGRKVVTNVTLNIDYLKTVLGDEVESLVVLVDGQLDQFGSTTRPFSQLQDYQDEWRNESGQAPLFVIDEAHMSLPCRGCSVEVLEWYSMHRHYGADIILMTQNIRKVHRDIKDMVEVHYYCVKNTALGSNKSYTRKVKNGANGEVLNENIRKYQEKFFKFYQSHTGSNKAIQEATAKDVKPIWHHWTVWLSCILLLSGPAVFFFNGGSFFDDPTEKKTQENKTPIENNVQAVAAKPKKVIDPLSNFKVVATGRTKQVAFKDGAVIRDLTFDLIHFQIFENDIKVFTLTNEDLIQMGYTFAVLADCAYRITYHGTHRHVFCFDEQENENKQQSLLPTSIF